MGTGICSRRQKGLLQMGFCLMALACLGSVTFFYKHLQQQVRSAESRTLKYKQQQEALSAQLQVVYEHRARLERSLQKERGEHKKTKEDFLVYKLEAQEALNKEKQDSMNRYGALSSQHKILKNQHEDVKKQLLDLQLQHNGLKLEHRRAAESHNQKFLQLQRDRESEVAGLQDTVYKLREESKLLRKAHQDIHSRLLSAQVQMEEFRQLKETLQKMPSFKDMGLAPGRQQQQPTLKLQRPDAGGGPLQLARQKLSSGQEVQRPLSSREMAAATPAGKSLIAQARGMEDQHQGNATHSSVAPRLQNNGPLGRLAALQEAHLPLAAWPQPGQRESHVIRFTRTVNSVPPNGNRDQKALKSTQGGNDQNVHFQEVSRDLKLSPASETARAAEKQPSVGSREDDDPVVQSWQDIVNKVNNQMAEEQVPLFPQGPRLGARSKQAKPNGNQLLTGQQRGVKLQQQQQEANGEAGKGGTDDEELQMDAGMIEREDGPRPWKEPGIQESVVPDEVADPAQDPNNQGEDEFEEAELDGKADQFGHTKRPTQHMVKEKVWKGAAGAQKTADDPIDDYQEDQEQEVEDHGGEVDDADDLELAQGSKVHPEDDSKKEEYY